MLEFVVEMEGIWIGTAAEANAEFKSKGNKRRKNIFHFYLQFAINMAPALSLYNTATGGRSSWCLSLFSQFSSFITFCCWSFSLSPFAQMVQLQKLHFSFNATAHLHRQYLQQSSKNLDCWRQETGDSGDWRKVDLREDMFDWFGRLILHTFCTHFQTENFAQPHQNK